MRKAVLLITFLFCAIAGFAQADIKVINSDYKDYYVPGTDNTYTITVKNFGPLDAKDVSVYNGIPNNVLNFTWTGPNGKSGINSAVSDLIPLLKKGEVKTYTVTFSVPTSFTGDLVSKTDVTAAAGATVDCAQCTDTDKMAVGADIVVNNTDNKPYYSPLSNNVYTVTVTNKGPLDAANVKVNNPIPAGITKFSWTGSNASAGTDMPLNNTISLLKNGETVTYTITLQVPAGYTGDLISQTSVTSNTTDPNPGCLDCIDTDKLLTGSDIVVVNTDGKTTYTAGGTNTYTITVENKGPDVATNVHVTNAIPTGIIQFSWTGSNGSNGTNIPLDNTIATLAVGSKVTYTILMQIPANFSGQLKSETVVVSESFDPYLECTQCVDIDTQANATDIVVVKTDNTDIYVPGTNTVYTIKVTNNGPLVANNVVIQDLVPAGIPAGSMSWTGSNGSSGANVPLNNTITSLAIGNANAVTYTVTVSIPAGFTGNLTNEVTMTSATADLTPGCEQCIDIDKPKAGVVVENDDSSATYIAGVTKTYTVKVTNYDAAAATNVLIQGLVSAGVDPANISWSGSNGTSGTGNLNTTIQSLGPGVTVTYTITVKVPSGFDQKTNLVHDVTYSVNGVPNTTVCAKCKDVDTPDSSADIQVVKTDNQSQFLLNTTNTYTIVVSNNGPSDAFNVAVVDKLPPGIAKMSWSGSNGASGTVTKDDVPTPIALRDVIPVLKAGETVTYIVNMPIPSVYKPADPSNPGSSLTNLINTVTVTSDTRDSDQTCPDCTDTDTPRADYVTVDDSTYKAEGLVKNILIKTPCVNITNFENTAECGFGYFHRNNSDFPIKEGMIIRNGRVKNSEGKYDGSGSSTTCSNKGDAELQAINCANGNCNAIQDASSVKFRFIAGGDKFSFRYLFASNEYGAYQCGFSDAFAFILKDETTGTPAQNLAVIPGTTTPVSVTNIRKQQYNPGCGDKNPSLFGQYNVSPAANVAASDINMSGQTVVMTASATVIPGHTYSIKLVIGDYTDTLWDSAVFIEAGSFDLGQPLVESVDGIKDNLPLCQGTSKVLMSGTVKRDDIKYVWKRNGVVIPGENDYKITITQDGLYTVVYKYDSGCEQTDDLNVVYTEVKQTQDPNDLYVCESSAPKYDLTVNEQVVLAGQNASEFTIYYYTSQADAEGFINPISDPKNYLSTGAGQTIYMSIEWAGATSSCVPIKTFKLLQRPIPKGTIQYVDNDTTPGFCRNSNSALTVTGSADLSPGGTYTILPANGVIIEPANGTINLTNAVPGNYTVNYTVPSMDGCPGGVISTTITVTACVTVTMKPIPTVCPGDPVVLECSDEGSGITYNWYDANNTLLATTNVPNYTLASSPVVGGSYEYSVVAYYGAEPSPKSSQTLVVNPIPVASISGTTNVCEAGSAIITFTGTPGAFVTYDDSVSSPVTIQLSSSGIVGTYELTTPSLNADITYQLISVEGSYTPGCKQDIPNTAPNSSVTITVITAPTASVSFGSSSTVCEGQATDVVFEGTPGAIVAYTKNGQSLNVTLSASGQPTVVNTGVLTEDTEYTIVSVTSSGAACVGYPDSSIIVDVVNIPKPALKQKAYICLDPISGATTRPYTLETGLDTATYDFVWYQDDVEIPGATQNSYEANTVAQYKVLVTDKVSGCTRTAVTDVLASLPPTGVSAEVSTAYFSDNATVEVTATPSGNYEYSLDFGPFQDSNIFEGVSSGTHQISVRDKEACAVLTTTVTVIDFPRFFTPNADGYNDTWNISSLNSEEIAQPNAKIYIFDRYGKLLKQITPSGAGWDGTYNGQAMPADDYWFIVEFEEQSVNKEFKSHFSLKR